MSGLNLAGVHVFKKAPGQRQFVLSETHPVLRLAMDEAVLFLQDGRVYSSGGDSIKEVDLPGWFFEQLRKCNPAVLIECGFSAEKLEKLIAKGPK